MLQRILLSKNLSAKDKFRNSLFYISRKRGANKAWKIRHQKVINLHAAYKEPCEAVVELEHQNKWSAFRNNVDLITLRICKNISGHADSRNIPEDIFVSDIEPTLINNETAHFLSHKSFYNRWFSNGIFPRNFLHCIDGQYLDADLSPINFKEFRKQADKIIYPVVMKPNWDSFGGKDVYFVRSKEDLLSYSMESKDFVVQEKIFQHEYFSKFNPVGLNTIRVNIYKSVNDNRWHILNMALRMGKEGSLDNETSGGIHTMINHDGFLNNYAVDKYGKKYRNHPDTGSTFDTKIPNFEGLKKLSLKIGEQIFFSRLVGLDMCYDENRRWRAIEINTKGHTIRFSQYGGQPFLGKFTDEVINFCKQNHWALQK